jgi:hypothetical protein
VLHVSLDLSIGEFTTDETLGIEDSVMAELWLAGSSFIKIVDWWGNLRVHGDLVLSRITNQTLGICESNLKNKDPLSANVAEKAPRKKKKKSNVFFSRKFKERSSGKLTNEGVVRFPWSLAMISIRSSLNTPTQE